MWSEATAAAAAADPPQGLNTTFYMMLYFGLGFSSLAFQVPGCLAACLPAYLSLMALAATPCGG